MWTRLNVRFSIVHLILVFSIELQPSWDQSPTPARCVCVGGGGARALPTEYVTTPLNLLAVANGSDKKLDVTRGSFLRRVPGSIPANSKADLLDLLAVARE